MDIQSCNSIRDDENTFIFILKITVGGQTLLFMIRGLLFQYHLGGPERILLIKCNRGVVCHICCFAYKSDLQFYVLGKSYEFPLLPTDPHNVGDRWLIIKIVFCSNVTITRSGKMWEGYYHGLIDSTYWDNR